MVMGVSGSGKSTVAEHLAAALHGTYLDADEFHPAANVAKQAAGIALTDEDRWPWLDALNAELRGHADDARPVVLACSALRQAYRDRLADGVTGLRVVYLRVSRAELERRLEHRRGHFMPASLLDSQLATLEEPVDAITVDGDRPLDDVVHAALAALTP